MNMKRKFGSNLCRLVSTNWKYGDTWKHGETWKNGEKPKENVTETVNLANKAGEGINFAAKKGYEVLTYTDEKTG